MPATLTARRLLTDIGSIEYPVITLADDGTLADISSDPLSRATTESEDTLTAAFFDIHTHGALGYDVMSATPAELARLQHFLATRGVAHYLPTTVTASVETTLRSLDSLANAIEAFPKTATPAADSASQAEPAGIHLEGPFLSHAKRGVHPVADLQKPDPALFDRFQQAARGHIRLLTLAPELPGAADLIAHAAATGVSCSLGHSNALAAQALAGITAGATSATHTFNAMRPLDHREPGILGVTLDDPRLFAELICDGIHVHPSLVRLWWRSKGPNRAILVTDAMSAAGMPEGDYKLGPLDVTVKAGRALLRDDLAQGKETLAGSVLTLDQAVANLQQYTGAPLAEAIQTATTNPATLLGQPERTRLAPGSPANLNRFNARNQLISTTLRGIPVQP